jgi:hypothetical protein
MSSRCGQRLPAEIGVIRRPVVKARMQGLAVIEGEISAARSSSGMIVAQVSRNIYFYLPKRHIHSMETESAEDDAMLLSDSVTVH